MLRHDRGENYNSTSPDHWTSCQHSMQRRVRLFGITQLFSFRLGFCTDPFILKSVQSSNPHLSFVSSQGVVSKHIFSGSQIPNIGSRGQPPLAAPQAFFFAGDRAWPLKKCSGDLGLEASPRQAPPLADREYDQ
jgi:hypothetical protein